jgi:tRNA A37 threonylcarbamoyladenosine dehydratase
VEKREWGVGNGLLGSFEVGENLANGGFNHFRLIDPDKVATIGGGEGINAAR